MSEAEEKAEHYFSAGLITQYERQQMIRGYCFVDSNNRLRWILTKFVKRWPEPRELTPDRMMEIQTDQLLGIGDGQTTLPQQLNEE